MSNFALIEHGVVKILLSGMERVIYSLTAKL
ncbi:Uncharacterised protein [Escherichia coli]|nr:Uncharacterised protein [Escherichia coli]